MLALIVYWTRGDVLESGGVAMSTSVNITDIRRVGDFHRVILRAQHDNELVITRGERESLTVQGPPDIVPRIETEVRQETLVIGLSGGWLEKLGDALTTSLTRPRIRYALTVRNLSSLEVCAMASVRASNLTGERLALRFSGAGEMRLDSIDVHLLEVDLPGAARIEVTGYAAEQRIMISGPAQYDAVGLASQNVQVTLKGIAIATVWASRELDATIRGPGRVLYRGAPRIKQNITPMGSLSCLGSD
jgi:hypothetical protein